MKKILLIIALFVLGCTPQQEKISEADVIKTVEGFFASLDVDNDNPDLIDEYVTDDFIYKREQLMNKEKFLEFVSSWHMIEVDFELSDFRITTDNNLAHISLFNKCRAITQTDSTKLLFHYDMLQSAFLVKEDGKIKIKYYSSDDIKWDSKPVE